jgi:hypothetical protein
MRRSRALVALLALVSGCSAWSEREKPHGLGWDMQTVADGNRKIPVLINKGTGETWVLCAKANNDQSHTDQWCLLERTSSVASYGGIAPAPAPATPVDPLVERQKALQREIEESKAEFLRSTNAVR